MSATERQQPPQKPSISTGAAKPRSGEIRFSTEASTPAQNPFDTERRRQLRGLLLLAFAVIAFSIWRFGLHRVFTPGWWRLW